MQKDIHFYLTYALARKVGLQDSEAQMIAWANQYTDDLTRPDIYGIQTQTPTFDFEGNWKDKQIQFSVLIPFHFVPGDSDRYPWMTTRDSHRVQYLVESAFPDPVQVGIALHAHQDSFAMGPSRVGMSR